MSSIPTISVWLTPYGAVRLSDADALAMKATPLRKDGLSDMRFAVARQMRNRYFDVAARAFMAEVTPQGHA